MGRSLSVPQLLPLTVRLDDYRNVYAAAVGVPMIRDNLDNKV
jgi:hypothetical protein